MSTGRVQSFTGIGIAMLIAAGVVFDQVYVGNGADLAALERENAALERDLDTARDTIARLTDELAFVDMNARLAVEANDSIGLVAQTAKNAVTAKEPSDPARERRLAEIATRIQNAARDRRFDAAQLMLARAEGSLSQKTRRQLVSYIAHQRTVPLHLTSHSELRRAIEGSMPVGVPHQVYARLDRASDRLEDPKNPASALRVRLTSAKRADFERLRGRSGCFTVTLSLDGSIDVLDSKPGACRG